MTIDLMIGIPLVVISFSVILFLLIVLPSIRRRVDREGGGSLCSIRAIVIMGRDAVRAGGSFYRITMHEKYLVICLLLGCSYSYKNIKIVVDESAGGRLVLLVDGIKVTIYGGARSVGDFRKKLEGKVNFLKSTAAFLLGS